MPFELEAGLDYVAGDYQEYRGFFIAASCTYYILVYKYPVFIALKRSDWITFLWCLTTKIKVRGLFYFLRYTCFTTSLVICVDRP